jgi:hypothetical protein
MRKYVKMDAPRSVKAPSPPRIAFLHVNKRRVCDGLVVGRSKEPVPAARLAGDGSTVSIPTFAAESPVLTVGAPRGVEPSAPGIPSCTMAVAKTIGSPMSSRTKAIVGVQSGKPTCSVSMSTTSTTPQEAARKMPMTCHSERRCIS